jgi:hypothetical protein
MPNPIKAARNLLKRTPFYAQWKELGWYPDYWYWNLRGRPRRTPHVQKQRTVTEYAERYGMSTLVETGTYYGEMVSAQKNRFREIYTVEYMPALAELARKRFAAYSNVQVYEGDSKVEIPKILSKLNGPVLFWLDAGYYGWSNLNPDKSRLAAELEAILAHRPDHIILMDDAHALDGTEGRLSIPALTEHIHQHFPGRDVEVKYDILRITPAR